MTFADHFSSQASEYAAFRPAYPDDLGAYLAATAQSHQQAWDCATGSGQAATMLARHFDRVVATDASAAQIRNAEPHERIEYGVATADVSGLPDRSCDLVTVAQAAHWFELSPFYAEARRVLKPGGIIAVWCYLLMETGHPAVDALVRHLQYKRLGSHWPAGRELVEDHYRSLPFPFASIKAPAFEMVARWTRSNLLGYISSWSAVARCRQFEGKDPLEEFAANLARVWPDDTGTLDVRWPLYLKVGADRV